MFWWLVTASFPLRGNSEGHVVQSEPAEHLMRLWCCIAECVLFNLIKMLIASSDTVNPPNKEETALPKGWSDIRTGNTFGFNTIYSAQFANPLCWYKELPSNEELWERLREVWAFQGLSPLLPNAWAAAKLGTAEPRLCPSSALAGTQCPTGGRAGSRAEALVQFAGSFLNWGVEKYPVLVHQDADNKAGNSGEHPRGIRAG